MKLAVATTIAQVLANNSRLLLAEDILVEHGGKAPCGITDLTECQTAAGGAKFVKLIAKKNRPNGCFRHNRTHKMKFNTNGSDKAEFKNNHRVGCEAKCELEVTRIPGAAPKLTERWSELADSLPNDMMTKTECQAGPDPTEQFKCGHLRYAAESGDKKPMVVMRAAMHDDPELDPEILTQDQVDTVCPVGEQGQCLFSCGDDYVPYNNPYLKCDKGTLAWFNRTTDEDDWSKEHLTYFGIPKDWLKEQHCSLQECTNGEAEVREAANVTTTAAVLQCDNGIVPDQVKYKCLDGVVTTEDGLKITREILGYQCKKE